MISQQLQQETIDCLERADWDKEHVIERLGGYNTKEPHYDLVNDNLSEAEQDKEATKFINFIEGL